MPLVDVLLVISIARGADSITSTTQKIDMPNREECVRMARWYNERQRFEHAEHRESGQYWSWQIAYDATCVKEAK